MFLSLTINHFLLKHGSYGASVTTGRKTGVATRLKSRQPVLITIHCAAHCLALTDAGENVHYIRHTFKPSLAQLYFFFFENSSVRMAGLKAIERLLNSPELKLKQHADTCWLSHDAACQTLVRVLPAVISSLEQEASERGDALAQGLSKVIKSYSFIATLYMMCDILPLVTRLSHIFQISDVDLTARHKYVTTTNAIAERPLWALFRKTRL